MRIEPRPVPPRDIFAGMKMELSSDHVKFTAPTGETWQRERLDTVRPSIKLRVSGLQYVLTVKNGDGAAVPIRHVVLLASPSQVSSLKFSHTSQNHGWLALANGWSSDQGIAPGKTEVFQVTASELLLNPNVVVTGRSFSEVINRGDLLKGLSPLFQAFINSKLSTLDDVEVNDMVVTRLP